MSGIYSSGPSMGDRDTTLRDLLSVIFKRKWLILGIVGFTAVLIGVKTATTPTTYSADATLLLNRQGARASKLERVSKQLPWVEVVESEVEVIQSIPVLQKAMSKLRDPKEGEPVDISLGKLASSIHVGVVGESNVLYVTGRSTERSLAPRITNAVAESYVEYHRELFKLPDPSKFIAASADSILGFLRKLEAERSELLSGLQTGNTNEQHRALINNRERLREQLAKSEQQIARLEAEIEDAREVLSNRDVLLPFTENTGSVQGSSIMDIVRTMNRKKDELRQLTLSYTENHPEVIAARRSLESLRESLNDQVRQIVAAREHDLRVQQRNADEVRRQIDNINEEIEKLVHGSGRLSTLNAQIDALKGQYQQLSRQSVDSEITGQSFIDYDIKILSRAIGATQDAKGDMVRLALGPILALMVGIGVAFYLENLDHSVGNREDVERHLEIPVLASFPENPSTDWEPNEPDGLVPFRKKHKG